MNPILTKKSEYMQIRESLIFYIKSQQKVNIKFKFFGGSSPKRFFTLEHILMQGEKALLHYNFIQETLVNTVVMIFRFNVDQT